MRRLKSRRPEGRSEAVDAAGNEYYYRVTSYNKARAGLTSAATFAAAPADLPSPWQNADVGAVYGGGAALNTGTGGKLSRRVV